MVEQWYYELEQKFKDVKCHAMVIMPNHFHCIIENTGFIDEHAISDEHVPSDKHILLGEHVGSPLRNIIAWFKTMTTNYYIRGVKQLNWTPFDGKLWQRNYWEHIIRNEQEYERISHYIINNPQKWKNDSLYR